MSGLNRAQLLGFLGGDVELRHTPRGKAVASFSVATTEKWKDAQGQPQERTEWHSVEAWGGVGEVCGKHLRKGSQVLVEGRLQTEKYQDKKFPEVTHKRTKIVADAVHFVGSRKPLPEDPGRPVRGGDAALERPEPPAGDFGPPPPGFDTNDIPF